MRVGNRYEFCAGQRQYCLSQREIEGRMDCIRSVKVHRPHTYNPIRLIIYAIMQGYAKYQFRRSFGGYHQAAAWMGRVHLEAQLYRDSRFVTQFNITSRHLAALYGNYRSEDMWLVEEDSVFDDEIDLDMLEVDLGACPEVIVINNVSYQIAAEPLHGRVRYVPARNLPLAGLAIPTFVREHDRIRPTENLRRRMRVVPATDAGRLARVMPTFSTTRRSTQTTVPEVPSQPARALPRSRQGRYTTTQASASQTTTLLAGLQPGGMIASRRSNERGVRPGESTPIPPSARGNLGAGQRRGTRLPVATTVLTKPSHHVQHQLRSDGNRAVGRRAR